MLAATGTLAFSQATVAGSQSQLEVKLVLIVKLAGDLFFSFSYTFLITLGDKIAASLPNVNPSAASHSEKFLIRRLS